VSNLQHRFGVSERRACKTLGVARSTCRYRPVVKSDEEPLTNRILELVRKHPRTGYRQMTDRLRQEGWRVNSKRVYRIWRQEGLKVPMKKAKKRRLGNGEGGVRRRRAERPDHVWALDFIFDRTSNGRPLKILSVIDEYTRECLALEVGRSLTGDGVVEQLVDLLAIRGKPESIRADNGPEFICERLRKFLERVEIGTSYIEPASPWENGFVESFHSRLRDECLACEAFDSVVEAREVIGHWRTHYNHRRPHSSLGGLPPAAFASQCAASVRATPSLQQHTAESPPHPVLS
jgi:transposase InsO family protein